MKNYPLKGRNFVIFFVDKPCYKHLYLVYANRKLFHFHFFLSLKLIKARIKSFNNLSLPVVFRGALGGISLFFLTSQEITHEFVRKKRFHKTCIDGQETKCHWNIISMTYRVVFSVNKKRRLSLAR